MAVQARSIRHKVGSEVASSARVTRRYASSITRNGRGWLPTRKAAQHHRSSMTAIGGWRIWFLNTGDWRVFLGLLQRPGTRLHRFDYGGRVQVPDVAVGRSNAGMAQLGLNDVKRRPFAGKLKGVGVA